MFSFAPVSLYTVLQNNRSVFQTVITFVILKTGPIHLVLVSLISGSPAGRQKPHCLKHFNWTSNAFFRYSNRFSEYFTLYQ